MKAILESFEKYKEYGARSNKKLFPIHNYIANVLGDLWGEEYVVHCLGENSKEFKVDGKYYDKDIDICVTLNEKPIFCLGIKFVTSNYKQNANNYFEGMMGETANIQAVNGLPYAQLIILRHQTPYYLKNELTPHKIEIINDKDIAKYVKLILDKTQAHRPYSIGILLVDIDEKNVSVKPTDLPPVFNSNIVDVLCGRLSVSNLFREIGGFKQCFKANL